MVTSHTLKCLTCGHIWTTIDPAHCPKCFPWRDAPIHVTLEKKPGRIVDTHNQWCVIPLARLTELVSTVAAMEIEMLTPGEIRQPIASFRLAEESLSRLHQLYEAYKRFYYDVCGLMNPAEEQIKGEGIEVPDA